MPARTHEWIAHALEVEGVDRVFGYMAEDNIHLMLSLDRAGIGVVQTRHELAATGMADGFARATGRLAVCSVGGGPGVAQTGTSLVTMRKKRSPVLLLVPEPSHPLKGFRQTEYLESTVERVVSATDADDLPAKLVRALELTESGPVAVQVPHVVLDGPGPQDQYQERDGIVSGREPAVPDGAAIEEMAALVLGVDRPPVLLAGAGAVRAGARDDLVRLAERTGCLLATTLQARGLFDGHPRDLGLVGTLGSELSAEVLSQAQCVLAVGSSLNPFTTGRGGLFKSARVVQVDACAESIGATQPVDVGIVGDARRVVGDLHRLLDRLEFDPVQLPVSRRAWIEEIERRIANPARLEWGSPAESRSGLDPRLVVQRLEQVLPDNRVLISDAGHFMRWVVQGLTVRDPLDFVWTADFASIGQGLAIAAGVALGRRERPCVCIAGDGGFSMAIHELATLVRYRIPLTVIVWNDSALGSEYQMLSRDGESPSMAMIPNPPFADVARAFGGRGLTVDSLAGLDALPELIQIGEGLPIVVDVEIDRDVRHPDLG
ncbi:MAG TPA: thiamine pyrophosphate-binding protein [Terriglobales bacterium]|nr:thiamine pyrophosphate-binding protein [Terriglobales bacterium]